MCCCRACGFKADVPLVQLESCFPASARTSFRFLAEENLQTGQTHQCCDIVSEDGIIPKGEACAAAVLWLAQPLRTRGAPGLQHGLILRFGASQRDLVTLGFPLSGDGIVAPKSRNPDWCKSSMHNNDIVSVIVG